MEELIDWNITITSIKLISHGRVSVHLCERPWAACTLTVHTLRRLNTIHLHNNFRLPMYIHCMQPRRNQCKLNQLTESAETVSNLWSNVSYGTSSIQNNFQIFLLCRWMCTYKNWIFDAVKKFTQLLERCVNVRELSLHLNGEHPSNYAPTRWRGRFTLNGYMKQGDRNVPPHIKPGRFTINDTAYYGTQQHVGEIRCTDPVWREIPPQVDV